MREEISTAEVYAYFSITKAVTMYKQLQDKADDLLIPGQLSRQIKNPKLGLTHNLGGHPDGPAIFVGIVGQPGV